MPRSDLQIAKTVLGVLRNFDENSLPELRAGTSRIGGAATAAEGCALLEYDLARHPSVILPESMHAISDKVLAHIDTHPHSESWGMIEQDIVALVLNDNPDGKSGRLLLFQMDFIDSVLQRLFPTERITPAERHTLLQCLSGLSMKEAAGKDNVGYETKRTQLKTVFQKTRFNKQQHLSNFLITHLTLEAASVNARRRTNTESDEMFFHYVDEYMGSYVRASVIQESAKRRFRIIELGDPAGTPVVCVHHLGLINFSEDEIEEIHRKKLKLICPLRHGALGPRDSQVTAHEHIEHAVAGIDLAVKLTAQSNPTIVSLLSGCLYAINYVERNLAPVQNLIMLGASYKRPVQSGSSSVFKKNLHQLATSHHDTFEATVSTLIENVEDTGSLKAVMKESHNNGGADVQAIDALFSEPKQVRAMQHRLKHSSFSIAQDLRRQAEKDWSSILQGNTDTQVHFVHGDKDALIPISHVEELTDTRDQFHLHRVAEAGNWIFGKYTGQTTKVIRSILDSKNP